MTSQYEQRGVSADKPDVHRAISGLDRGLYPGAFCKIVPDTLSGDPDHCVVLHADGAGTKSTLAYLHYLDHHDPTVFRGIAQDSLVMNLDDLLCVGATTNFVLSNTIGRNAKVIGGDILKEIILGYEQLVSRLHNFGVAITSCGGETADLGDLVRTVIVDSTLAARLPRNAVIDCSTVRAGHVIVGLASFGRASYEDHENSGIGTNGFTTARHVLLSHHYAERSPETYAPEIADRAYQGRFRLDDRLPHCDMSVGEALLSPTRTYAPVLHRILDSLRGSVSAIYHNSGGGLTKCLRFGERVHYIKDNLFPAPAIFGLIRSEAGLSFQEMCRTFNMGHRLEVICEERAAKQVIAIAEGFDVAGRVVGRVESASSNRISISSNSDTVEFME